MSNPTSALHHDDADCQHRKRKSHRQTLTQVLRIYADLRMKILSGKMKGIQQAHDRAHRLRQHRGSRRADDTEPDTLADYCNTASLPRTET